MPRHNFTSEDVAQSKGALHVIPFTQKTQSGILKIFSKAADKFRPDNRTGKPVVDIHWTGYEPRVQYPRIAMPYWAMYETMHMCAEAKTITLHLIHETFRNRGEWKEKFAVKCKACGLEMKAHPKDGLCQRRSCRSTVMIDRDQPGVFGVAPDDDELNFFNNGRQGATWRGPRKVNRANMNFWQLLELLAFDLCVTDDAYAIMVKRYYQRDRNNQKQVFAEPEEIVRGHPNVVRIVADDYGNMGGLYYQCPIHRTKLYTKPANGALMGTATVDAAHDGAADMYDGWRIPTEVDTSGTCPVMDVGFGGRICGMPLRNVHYVGTDSGGAAPKQFYFEDECKHLMYFTPSPIYGLSPVITLYRHMRSLIKIPEYVQTYFEKRRIPRGIVAINTPRKENIKLLKQEINREADDNQHDLPFLAVEGSNQRGWIEFIPFADKLNELELQNTTEEYRQIIGAFYGVSPIFQGDTSQGGGLNNEGLQITVTNRSVETFQKLFNEQLFPWVAENFGITDHEFILNPSEEKDQAHKYQLELLKQQVSLGKDQHGLRFLRVDENGEYIHEDKPDPNHPSQLVYEQQQQIQPGQQSPGQTQPGGQQQTPLNSDAKKSATKDAEERLHGEPNPTDGQGNSRDLF